MKLVNNVLVVLLKGKNDFLIAQKQGWYRIPTSSRTPLNFRNNEVKYLAFYFPKVFGDLKYSIRYYAKVANIEVVSRQYLFSDEMPNSKSEKKYHKISFTSLLELPRPIVSMRGRLLVFIPTSFDKLICAEEINDLFNDSPLENKLWQELKRNKLLAERQFVLKTNEKKWICDFAFFCKTGNINVECDGDAYHTAYNAVMYDKARNNEIEAVANWSVLRFTTNDIEQKMDYTILTIQRKIDKLGGIHDVHQNQYRYVLPSAQMGLDF